MRDGLFFFFKQKTAYEMLRSLVGSEMCIRDREIGLHETSRWHGNLHSSRFRPMEHRFEFQYVYALSLIHI